MEPIKINMSFSGIALKIKKNIGMLFLLLLLVLVGFELFELKTPVSLVLSSQKAPDQPITPKKTQQVRINFDNYQKVIDRINGGATYQPSSSTLSNPFLSITK